MAGYDGRGTKFPLTIVRGADLAFELTVLSGASPVNLSSATIAGNVYDTAGTLVDTLTAAVSGAGSNVVTLSFTDTETTALTSAAYRWTLWVTRGADKRPWLAGPVRVVDSSDGGASTSGTTTTLTVDGDLSVSVDVAAIGLLDAAPAISSGVVAPASTPEKVGDIYIDTAAPAVYVATGTATAADWACVLTAE